MQAFGNIAVKELVSVYAFGPVKRIRYQLSKWTRPFSFTYSILVDPSISNTLAVILIKSIPNLEKLRLIRYYIYIMKSEKGVST